MSTPFVNPSGQDGSFYFIDIVAITVGKTRVEIDYKSDIRGTAISTWAHITRLPLVTYTKLRDEFKLQMGTNYPAAAVKEFSIFDTCYDTTDQSSITAPSMSFTFRNKVTVDLHVSGILYVVNSTLSCLAFAQTSNPGGFAIFGSRQQRTLEMVFDVDNGMLGIGQHGCA
ncbi:hypothetical protein CASFOL_035885 [Castilleja foliolosa]|uniref:Peptidase A1 domain-containing protein n=1 Tax=Castilleja foliolosa TaxID=1961234 RepID=A0ABD3BUR6_9LAMI